MQELYIVRHGIAVPSGTPGIPDDERPLTPKGEKRVHQIGCGLAALAVTVDAILTSPLPRALRTAEIVASELGLTDRLETSQALTPDASAQNIADWLRERTVASLMIVGHNPSLSELVGLLLVGTTGAFPFELKKGAVAALSTSPFGGTRLQLDWTAPPALLRQLR